SPAGPGRERGYRYWPPWCSPSAWTAGEDTAWTSRSRSSRNSSPEISTSRPTWGRNSTRSPRRTLRTSGPTRVTSPHTSRFGAVAAVAGISRPLRERRSPSSGWITTSRSPGSRMSSAVDAGDLRFRGAERGLCSVGLALVRGIRPIVSAARGEPAGSRAPASVEQRGGDAGALLGRPAQPRGGPERTLVVPVQGVFPGEPDPPEDLDGH